MSNAISADFACEQMQAYVHGHARGEHVARPHSEDALAGAQISFVLRRATGDVVLFRATGDAVPCEATFHSTVRPT